MAGESLLQQAFAETGVQLDRIIDAYERKENSGYPYYIKFTSSGPRSWFAQSGIEQFEGISSVVWKVNSPEICDFESNLTAIGYPITEGNAQNANYFYNGYLIFAQKDAFMQSEYYEEFHEQMKNGEFNSGQDLTIKDKQVIYYNPTLFKAEICDASEF